jgi:threonine synthase
VRLHAVQAAGCAPLSLAWDRASEFARPAQHWSEVMTVWPEPHSLADGILDDETYDWIGVVEAMRRNGGSPVVAAEAEIERAHALGRAAGYDVSPTGSAALAGVLTLRGGAGLDGAGRDRIGDDERVVLAMTGVAR